MRSGLIERVDPGSAIIEGLEGCAGGSAVTTDELRQRRTGPRLCRHFWRQRPLIAVRHCQRPPDRAANRFDRQTQPLRVSKPLRIGRHLSELGKHGVESG